MSIWKCPKMTSIVSSSNENKSGGSSNADIDDGHSLHLFCQVSFGNLKELRTPRNPFSCGHKIDASLFIGLEKLAIFRCEGIIMSLFTSSIAANLVSLRALRISYCDELVQVIKDDEEEKAASGGQRTTLLFPKFQELHLYHLPKLVSFYEWKYDVELPSLRKVEIQECPNMKYFTLGFLVAPNLEDFKTDLNNCLDVSFHSLKQLKIVSNENPLYCYKTIHVSLFKRFEVLVIWRYKGSTSLFTSSTAENLVSLREISIGRCDEMKLELDRLRKLVSFCEWEFDVEFPSLREVNISECPDMKHFTLGLLTTPKLEVVRINWKKIGGLKDLNGAVQRHFEKKQQEEKEGGAEV
ncbi:hypothetical protein C2S51_029512 [Perilla frutescens var. frutescens]|nr:hypothetical protein C2S51_029512 [Perilla frutescens var. frutescens]